MTALLLAYWILLGVLSLGAAAWSAISRQPESRSVLRVRHPYPNIAGRIRARACAVAEALGYEPRGSSEGWTLWTRPTRWRMPDRPEVSAGSSLARLIVAASSRDALLLRIREVQLGPGDADLVIEAKFFALDLLLPIADGERESMQDSFDRTKARFDAAMAEDPMVDPAG